MPEITVAITSHNLQAYISQCLDELLNQTFQNFDILIYDDCSTDRTREILARYGSEYPEKIHIILGKTPLGSPALSRNAILDSNQIDGRYLVFLDGDDTLQPNFLEKLYTTAIQTNAEITLCAYDRFEHETGHVLCQEMKGFPSEISIPVSSDILAFINGALWNKLIQVSVIEKNGRITDMPVSGKADTAWKIWDVFLRG